ncbi:MAG: ABC transporter substrate-binding protein [Alphaproteobacteria bacterium]|nr:ABC transporter substrate-binding protein [Alphaproteobacteria bacterium]
MKKLKAVFVFLLFLSSCFSARAQTAAASAEQSPEAWLLKKGYELLDVLSIEETKARYLKLRRIAKEVFNQKEMPRLVMGKNWKNMSVEQQEALQLIFFDYFVVTYGSSSFSFRGVSLQVSEKVPAGKDILLKTKIKLKDEEQLYQSVKSIQAQFGSGQKEDQEPSSQAEDGDFEILFALRKKQGGYYIRDAKFEGQSIIMFLRDQIEKEYKRASYDTDVFLEAMRQKINNRYRAAEDLAQKQKDKKK